MKTIKDFQLTKEVKTLSLKQKNVVKGGTQDTEHDAEMNRRHMVGHWITYQ